MRNFIGIITIYGGLKNIYGIYMSYLWHLDELSMALRLAIYGIFCTRITRIIFLHTDLTELTDFIRFIRGAKNILWDIDERVVCGNWIHGINGIWMRCDTWQMWHRFLRTFSLYYFLFKINYLFFLRARGYFIKTCVICVICHTLRRCLSAWNSSSWRLPSTMNDVFVNIEGCDVRVLPD